MVRWCAGTSAYRVVGTPERRLSETPLSETPLDRHLGRPGEGGRPAARPRRPRRRRPRATRAGETALSRAPARWSTLRLSNTGPNGASRGGRSGEEVVGQALSACGASIDSSSAGGGG